MSRERIHRPGSKALLEAACEIRDVVNQPSMTIADARALADAIKRLLDRRWEDRVDG